MTPSWLPIAFLMTSGFARSTQEHDSIPAITQAQREAYEKNDNPPEGDLLALVDRCWKVHDRSADKTEQYDALREVLWLTAFMASKSVKGADQWRAAMGKIVSDFCDDARVMELMDDDMPIPEILEEDASRSFAKIAAATKSADIKAAVDTRIVRSLLARNSAEPLNAADTRKLVAMLKKLAKDYPDLKVRKVGLTYKEWVEKTIYVVEHLKIGQVVPDIEGADLEGVKFKLSDYRGKVVLLDFWGYW